MAQASSSWQQLINHIAQLELVASIVQDKRSYKAANISTFLWAWRLFWVPDNRRSYVVVELDAAIGSLNGHWGNGISLLNAEVGLAIALV